jgi:hypothetical protein
MNYDDEKVYEMLLDVCLKHGCRPDVPIEAEDFFRELVATYSGSEEGFAHWLEEQVVRQFRSIRNRPEWLQSPEWPVFQGKPMLFVGQIDLPEGSTAILNHNASFYVFWDYGGTGSTKVIVQAEGI